MNEAKQRLREELRARYRQLWSEENAPPARTPFFADAAKAAENLRRLPAYRLAKVIAVTAEPALLQVRINALMDGKVLLAATPGLKQGLVRLTGQAVPMPRRHIDLQGNAMFKAGKPLPLPHSRLGQVDMLVSTALALDKNGVILHDGRGLLDVLVALFNQLKVLPQNAPVLALAHEEQMVASLPCEPWDISADVIVTPNGTMAFAAKARPLIFWEKLNPAQARLPLIKAVRATAAGCG